MTLVTEDHPAGFLFEQEVLTHLLRGTFTPERLESDWTFKSLILVARFSLR